MERRDPRPLADLLDRALETRRGNLVAGLGLLLFSVVALVLVRKFGAALLGGQGPSSLWLPLFMALVSVPVFGGLVLLFGARVGFPRGLRYGVAAYATVGLVAFLFGVPGHVAPYRAPLGPFWPFFALWFHPCLAGFGLWPCPGG